jgi:hypothetical protein
MPKRTDSNQQAIMDALRACGCGCYDTHSVSHGFPDLIVALPSGKVIMVEVKSSVSAKYTPDETQFAQECPAIVYRIITPEQAVEVVRDA